MKNLLKVTAVALALLTLVMLIEASIWAKPKPAAPKVQRMAMVIGIKPEKISEYKKLHANAWPAILNKIRECNIRNYSIYLTQADKGKYYLFGYWEYTGKDFNADMKKMAADPTTRRWWKLTDPCQSPVPACKKGEKWHMMEEVFHTN